MILEERDIHELAISYCQCVYKNKKMSAKEYFHTYIKAIRTFEKQCEKISIGEIDDAIMGEIKQQL